MYVITFANPKGGSGKTTSAMLLAEQIAISGGRVAILDLDPNANILAWAQARETEGREVPFAVHARPQAEETVELIDNLSGEADYLIIDLEGSKDQIVKPLKSLQMRFKTQRNIFGIFEKKNASNVISKVHREKKSPIMHLVIYAPRGPVSAAEI